MGDPGDGDPGDGDPSAQTMVMVGLVALVTRTHGGEPGGGSGDPVTLEPSDLGEG